MKLAESSARKLEKFFKDYLDDEEFVLPKIYFYTGRFSGFLTRIIKVHGITVGSRIFILPDLVRLNKENNKKLPEDLAAHEIAHVLQYKRDGFFKFLYRYVRDYRRNLKKFKNRPEDSKRNAYLAIPYEIEARETAAEFVRRSKEENSKKQP